MLEQSLKLQNLLLSLRLLMRLSQGQTGASERQVETGTGDYWPVPGAHCLGPGMKVRREPDCSSPPSHGTCHHVTTRPDDAHSSLSRNVTSCFLPSSKYCETCLLVCVCSALHLCIILVLNHTNWLAQIPVTTYFFTLTMNENLHRRPPIFDA